MNVELNDMNQDRAVSMILRDLTMMGLIPEESKGEIRPYLNALWVAGWEKGRESVVSPYCKQLGQYNKAGKLINTFKSIEEASRQTGFSTRGIHVSMQENRAMRQGWVWKHL